MNIAETLTVCRVLPVITAQDVETTVRLVQALSQGGMKAVEITLRTAAALESISAIVAEVPDLLVAAGTVTSPVEMLAAQKAGATIQLSPGSSQKLLRTAREEKINFIPGVATASEVMQGLDEGYDCFKLFPAVTLGGVDLLNSLAGPFPHVRFCPTGGLSESNFREFLSLTNVVCCGGSWMVAASLVENSQWGEIERLAKDAMSLVGQ